MSDYSAERQFSSSVPIPATAHAIIAGSPQYPGIKGKVIFTQTSQGIIVEARIFGLPITMTGFFAFHLHEGACGSPGTDPANYFPEVGKHFNPQQFVHPLHAGDFPPLLETKDGVAYLCFLTDRITLRQVIGRAVIIHLNPDDFTTQPSGNSGTKIACGTVVENPRNY